jgi:hypothetical protein
MAVTHPTASVRNAMCDLVVDQLDDGNIYIYDSTETTLLATHTFSSPAFGDAGASLEGQASANSITDATASTDSTAAVAQLCDSTGNIIVKCSVSGSTGDGDIKLSTTSSDLAEGQTVSISSLTYTAPV